MIGYIKGYFHPSPDGSVIIENTSGVGFLVNVPLGSELFKFPEGSEVKVFTSMQVKEDDISLYGFVDKEDLELFELLITVNGIGAKGALSLMSALPGAELRRAIGSSDIKAICQAQGVGKKIAERLVLELKDKVGAYLDVDTAQQIIQEDVPGDARSEALSALMSLGYSRNEATSAIAKIKGEDFSAEDYIKQALKNI